VTVGVERPEWVWGELQTQPPAASLKSERPRLERDHVAEAQAVDGPNDLRFDNGRFPPRGSCVLPLLDANDATLAVSEPQNQRESGEVANTI
jgi:hypothetical protein